MLATVNSIPRESPRRLISMESTLAAVERVLPQEDGYVRDVRLGNSKVSADASHVRGQLADLTATIGADPKHTVKYQFHRDDQEIRHRVSFNPDDDNVFEFRKGGVDDQAFSLASHSAHEMELGLRDFNRDFLKAKDRPENLSQDPYKVIFQEFVPIPGYGMAKGNLQWDEKGLLNADVHVGENVQYHYERNHGPDGTERFERTVDWSRDGNVTRTSIERSPNHPEVTFEESWLIAKSH